MLSEAISLRRLRLYEIECRPNAVTSQNPRAKAEFNKLEKAFGRAAMKLQAVCNALPDNLV